MEQRTRDILKFLLREKNYSTTADVAAQLSVSAKTVSRQLPKVEKVLNAAGLQLEKKSGAGLLIVGSEVKRYALAAHLKSADKKEYTPVERRSIIISKLLSSREPIKLFVLSSAVNVTDSTISNDLDKLEPWFREQSLKLLRKPGLGVSLLGDERDLRRAIVRYIYDHVGEERLLNLLQDNLPEDDDAAVAQVSKFLLELIDAGEWRRLEQLIRATEGELGYRLSDNAFIGLTVHLSLALRRIKNHEPVTCDKEICSRVKDSREFAAAKKLAKKISDTFGVDMPDSEICYMTMHILGARSRYSSANLGTISMMDNFRLVTLARQIMKRAAKITGRDIDKNQNLLGGLVNHLAPTISRLKMNM
ncbi:MAG: PRD domain-containing protein, partial [Selenomonadaceae bacterium]|nr:PRD domain-containing protein [Selenomonadaceae bacterium]